MWGVIDGEVGGLIGQDHRIGVCAGEDDVGVDGWMRVTGVIESEGGAGGAGPEWVLRRG